MKQVLEVREEELRPGQKIEDKKQISIADPEARIMKQKGDFEYAYNAQISVDGKSQVIVGQHVSQQANDAQEVAPAWDEVEETSDGKEPLRWAMNERMSQPESQALYARRKTIVEPVFGQIKNSGFRGFGLRGKEKVAGEFSLVCVAHNLKKIIFAALRGEVCPEFGKRAAWA